MRFFRSILVFAFVFIVFQPSGARAEEEIVFRFTAEEAEAACRTGPRNITSEDGGFRLFCMGPREWLLQERGERLNDIDWIWSSLVKNGTALQPPAEVIEVEEQP